MKNPEQGGEQPLSPAVRIKKLFKGMYVFVEIPRETIESLVKFVKENPSSAEAEEILFALEDFHKNEMSKYEGHHDESLSSGEIIEQWRRGQPEKKKRIEDLAERLLSKN